MYDVLIIGAGPAGQAAAVMAKKLELSVFVITKEIKNLSGYNNSDFINTTQLASLFESKISKSDIKLSEVTRLEKNIVSFSAEISSGELYYAHSIIITTGKQSSSFDMLTEKDSAGVIKTDSNLYTTVKGVFAAGQAGSELAVAVGEGAKAGISARDFLKNQSKLT